MNTSEKLEEIDYEPDVLRFKKIWNQMKETHQQDPKITEKPPTHKATKPQKQSNSKNQKPSTQNPPKKQAILSSKNVSNTHKPNPNPSRNPKHNPQTTIQIVTNPLGYHNNDLYNQKNNTNKQTLLQMGHSSHGSNGNTTDIRALQRQNQQKDYQLSLLRVSNTRNQDRIRVLEQQIFKRDQKIGKLEAMQRQLITKNSGCADQERVFDYGKVEYQNFRSDSRRLLKMLQSTDQYQTFANLALDDNGVRFLTTVNQKTKGLLDTNNKTRLHFCTCNKDFIPQSSFWVPDKIHSFGKQFIKQRNGEMTLPELQLLLYQLNKIWREREKRLINTITSQKSKQIGQLKRKIASNKNIRQQ